MEITTHSICNTIIGKPSDMSDDECSGLPARIWRDENGPWATSFWRPDADELAALVAGGSVALTLRVNPGQHPVTAMQVYMKETT